jgi:hypothetical protein
MRGELRAMRTGWSQNTGHLDRCPSAKNITILSPYVESRSQKSWNNVASVPSTFATRFNDIGIPLAIF